MSAVIGPVDAPGLHLMTWNIRRPFPHMRREHPDRWPVRAPVLRRMLAEERPHVLAVQEAMPEQLPLVRSTLGPDVVMLGRGRDADGRGEGCPIFVDGARLEVREWEQIALSRTPRVPGSRSWGTSSPRVAVFARLRDRQTDRELLVVNTHLDVASPMARREGAALIARRVTTAGGRAVVVGDANASINSAPYRQLTDGAALRDAWTSADARLTPEWRTFANYRPPRLGGRRIDWMLVSAGVRVRRIAINGTRVDGAAASDHEAVHAVLELT